MFRIKVAMIILGGVLAFFGIQELRVGMGSSAEPESVELKDLEAGTELTSNHIIVGEHMGDYAALIYEYEGSEYSVTHAYYPIISTDHRFFSDLNAAAEKYSSLDQIPDAEFPRIDDFKVLVKTKRFKTVSAMPKGLQLEDKLQGLVVNLVSSISSEETKLIQQEFPHFDSANVFVIEEGRKPTSIIIAMLMIAGGVVVSLGGLGWLLLGLRQ